MSDDVPSGMQLVTNGVWFRERNGPVRPGYLKREFERIFPDEWTSAELRAIADHMDKQPPHLGGGG